MNELKDKIIALSTELIAAVAELNKKLYHSNEYSDVESSDMVRRVASGSAERYLDGRINTTIVTNRALAKLNEEEKAMLGFAPRRKEPIEP